MFGPMRKSKATGALAASSPVVSPFAVVIEGRRQNQIVVTVEQHQRAGGQPVEWKITQIGRKFCPIYRGHYRLALLGDANRGDQQKQQGEEELFQY